MLARAPSAVRATHRCYPPCLTRRPTSPRGLRVTLYPTGYVRERRYAPRMDASDRPVVVDRRATPRGELVLRRAGEHFEVIANGTFLMDTRDGRSERALVREAVAGRDRARVLIGGLGVGCSLDEALRSPRVAAVVVCEVEPTVVEWARTHLGGCGLDDPRVRLVVADLGDALDLVEGGFDAVCLDVDNGPGWLVHPANAALYADAGLDRLRARLLPGGRLTVWAAAADAAFETRLRSRFARVRTVAIPVARGPDDVVYVAEREGAWRRR
jgi:spermidine synthase